MAGDGVSMPTQLAQLGSVAKTQARAQQAAQPSTSFSEQLDKKESLKVQRVKETQKAEKSKINPDDDRRKKRKKKRQEKRIRQQMTDSENQEIEEAPTDEENSEEEIGLLVDLRA